jgi:hypothetical protein
VTADGPPNTTATEEPPAEAVQTPPPPPEAPPAAAESVPPPPPPPPPAPAAEETPPPPPPAPEISEETGLPVNIDPEGPGPKIIGFEPIKPPPPPAPPKPRPKRPPRPRDPLPWPELRSAAAAIAESSDPEELKDLFRLLPEDVREETITAVREYRKGARRPVSAFAGKSLARAVHTARRGRRKPETDDAVSEAIGQALAAEVIASLDVEVAAEVILPKRDLLDREAKTARRRQKAEDDRERDERRRRAREASGQQGGTFGSFSGTKIRGLDEVAKLLQEQQSTDE